MIQRTEYLEILKSLKDKNLIKMLVGVRRCGKSTIMQLFREYLKTEGISDTQTVFLNFEDFENRKYLNDIDSLYYHIIHQLDLSKPCYVFLDEVQNVKEFERVVDGLFVKPNVDVYVTGSNAYLLSSELGTLLTGRYISIPVYPLSFKEYTSAFEDNSRLDLLFSQYLQNGGMPGMLELPSNQMEKYLQNIYNDIAQKDIFIRHNWYKEGNFELVIKFMLDNIGSPLSSSKISNVLKSEGKSISYHTIDNYLNALTEAYLFYKVPRYDIKGKNLLRTQEKYYTVDLGFKEALLGKTKNSDLGHNLENIVFLELLRRNRRVYIGKADRTEVDFAVMTNEGDWEYFQVAWSTRGENTFEREMRPFELIKDYNKRTLLTMDVEPESTYKGIPKINIIDWLLK
ncbi:MAG: ATP-binding protein [Chitinophagales bacterium]|nr:ATP-binding protein [Chitinophagales bacterium]MCZ2392486.1 ATP-binding protein [Chitinophagales bacterium]